MIDLMHFINNVPATYDRWQVTNHDQVPYYAEHCVRCELKQSVCSSAWQIMNCMVAVVCFKHGPGDSMSSECCTRDQGMAAL